MRSALLFCMIASILPQAGCSEGSNAGNVKLDILKSGIATSGDVQHMHRLARERGGAMRMDLSDPVQYRYLLARTAASGKTRENSPQFFAMLEEMKQRHAANKPGSDIQTLDNAPRDHILGDFVRILGTSNFRSTAFATIQNGADYNFVDNVVWNEAGTQQISDYGWGEVYGDGRKLAAQATGPIPADSSALVAVDSINLVTVNGVEESFYLLEPTKIPPGGILEHPRDANADNIVTICLDRNYGDCDYPLVGQRVVKFPIKGRITFPFPVTQINNTGQTFVKLVELNGGPKEMIFGPFYNWITISPTDNRTVLWDIPQASGQFNGIMFQRYQDVDFFLSISVKMQRGTKLVDSTAKISSIDRGASQSSPDMPKAKLMQIVYSCLAKGTKVLLADGKTANIEDITRQTLVKTSESGPALPVADISVGIERIPMIRITDSDGRELLMTSSHPVMTPDRSVVWAEELSAGGKVLTETGVRTLVKVSREMYNDNVYNLKLDRSQLKVAAKGSTMYANGFLVGDLAMQKSYEFKNTKDLRADTLKRLPAKWHTDYLNSIKLASR